LATLKISLFAGLVASFIGLIALVLSWNLFDYFGGPLPGYQFLLFPGNLSLVHVWHPLFTEEIDLVPKMGLVLVGQFTIVAAVTAVAYKVGKGVLDKHAT